MAQAGKRAALSNGQKQGSDRVANRGGDGAGSLIRIAALGMMLGIWTTAGAATSRSAGLQAPGLIETQVILSPRRPVLAHVRFCLLYEGQCDRRPDRRSRTMTLQQQMDEISRINRRVNRAIRPQPDRPGFDSWDINVTAGDCEDYALQKRNDLIQLGWPTDRVRLALGRTARGEPHAVLLVRVGDTDYVLDSLHDRVLRWDQTGHVFLMLQDRHDPRSWHTITPRRGGMS